MMHRAIDLACCPFIVSDLQRIIRRKVIEPAELKAITDPDTFAASVRSKRLSIDKNRGFGRTKSTLPVWRLERHRLGGARLVLADQVGLGKTVQLAMAALLIALDDPNGGPILVLAPKSLLQQWQDELMELLQLPSARWNGQCMGR